MVKGTQVKIFGVNGSASPQEMNMLNMKALPLMVKRLRQMLKFSDMYVKGHVQGQKVKTVGMNRMALSQGICM